MNCNPTQFGDPLHLLGGLRFKTTLKTLEVPPLEKTSPHTIHTQFDLGQHSNVSECLQCFVFT